MCRKVVFMCISALFLLLAGTSVYANSTESTQHPQNGEPPAVELTGDLGNQVLALEVKYDIALAEKNFEEVSKLLREIGLYYLGANQIKIAEGYVWRSKIVAEKHGVLRQDLQSTAMLSKISMQLGLSRDAMEFQEEYLEILARISEEAQENNPIAKSQTAASLNSSNEKAQGSGSEFPVSVAFTLLSLVLVLTILWHFQTKTTVISNTSPESSKRKPQPSDVTPEKLEIKQEGINKNIPFQENTNTLSDIDINLESVNIPDAEDEPIQQVVQEKITEAKPSQNTRIANTKPEFSGNTSSNPITAQDVLRARGPLFDELKSTPKIPMWVSGIEHHFKSLNSFRGIRFDFNYSGDFSEVKESVYVAFGDFIRSFSDDVAEMENVKSVSSLLVKTGVGLVFQTVVSPVDSSFSAIPQEVVDFYMKEFEPRRDYQLVYSTHYNGDQKVVLKSVSREQVLVS